MTRYSNGIFSLWEEATKVITTQSLNFQELRKKAYTAYRLEPMIKGALSVFTHNVVGAGLQLQPKPITEILGMSEEEGTEWAKKTKRLFQLYCQRNNFFQTQRTILNTYKILGDVPVFFKTNTKRNEIIAVPMDNYIIDGSYNKEGFVNGVKLDDFGEVATIKFLPDRDYKTTTKDLNRVNAKGRINFILLRNAQLAGQVRGEIPFANLHNIAKNFNEFLQAEVASCKIRSRIVGAVTTSGVAAAGAFAASKNIKNNDNENEGVFVTQDGTMTKLNPEEKIEFFNTERKAPSLMEFIESVASIMGMALGIPPSMIMKKFDKSYSASRAEIIEAWKVLMVERSNFVAQFLKPFYQQWLRKEILEERIKADGFFSDDISICDAWCNCEFQGVRQENVDFLKEVKAYSELNNMGVASKEYIARMYGLEYEMEKEKEKENDENKNKKVNEDKNEDEDIDDIDNEEKE